MKLDHGKDRLSPAQKLPNRPRIGQALRPITRPSAQSAAEHREAVDALIADITDTLARTLPSTTHHNVLHLLALRLLKEFDPPSFHLLMSEQDATFHSLLNLSEPTLHEVIQFHKLTEAVAHLFPRIKLYTPTNNPLGE